MCPQPVLGMISPELTGQHSRMVTGAGSAAGFWFGPVTGRQGVRQPPHQWGGGRNPARRERVQSRRGRCRATRDTLPAPPAPPPSRHRSQPSNKQTAVRGAPPVSIPLNSHHPPHSSLPPRSLGRHGGGFLPRFRYVAAVTGETMATRCPPTP